MQKSRKVAGSGAADTGATTGQAFILNTYTYEKCSLSNKTYAITTLPMVMPKKYSSAKPTAAEGRFSFSLYQSDLDAINSVITGLGERGLKVDRTKVVRGLLHTTPAVDLFAYGVVLFRADEAKTGPRNPEYVAERFTIVLALADMQKVERVRRQLQKQRVKMNDSYLLRALLRSVPAVEALAPVFKQYLAEFPDGRYRAAKARQDA